MNHSVSIIACQMRAMSHENLAQLAARLAHDVVVIRDMLSGQGLESTALEVATNAAASVQS